MSSLRRRLRLPQEHHAGIRYAHLGGINPLATGPHLLTCNRQKATLHERRDRADVRGAAAVGGGGGRAHRRAAGGGQDPDQRPDEQVIYGGTKQVLKIK